MSGPDIYNEKWLSPICVSMFIFHIFSYDVHIYNMHVFQTQTTLSMLRPCKRKDVHTLNNWWHKIKKLQLRNIKNNILNLSCFIWESNYSMLLFIAFSCDQLFFFRIIYNKNLFPGIQCCRSAWISIRSWSVCKRNILLHKSNPDATVSKLNFWKNLQKNSKKTLNKIKKTLKNL